MALVPVETYQFRGGGILTVMGRNFGADAQVLVGPDPQCGDIINYI